MTTNEDKLFACIGQVITIRNNIISGFRDLLNEVPRLDALEQQVEHEKDVTDNLSTLNTHAHAGLRHNCAESMEAHELMHHYKPPVRSGTSAEGFEQYGYEIPVAPEPGPWQFRKGDTFAKDKFGYELYRVDGFEGNDNLVCTILIGDTDLGPGYTMDAKRAAKEGYDFKRAEPEPLSAEAPPGPPEAERGARDRAAEKVKEHRDRLTQNNRVAVKTWGIAMVQYDVLMTLLELAYEVWGPSEDIHDDELAERLVKAYEKGN